MSRDMRIEQLQIIGQVQNVIAKADNLDEALKDGVGIITRNGIADYVVVWFDDDSVLRPYYWIGPFDLTSETRQTGEGVVGEVYESGEALRLLNYSDQKDHKESAFAGTEGEIGSMVCAPLSTKHEKLGCIQFMKKEAMTDDQADGCEMLALLIALTIDENANFKQGETVDRKVLMSARNITREFLNGEVLTKVLKGVNMDVYEGEFLALLGESGCGKSTFLNILGGMDSANSGQLTYMGQDISKANQEELTKFRRDNIGFIFQSYNLMPNLTARQNLDLIAELVENPMSSEEALELVELGDKKDNYPSQLSGGQQQRISIARALVKRPKLIFADEPTAALDYATSIQVLKVIEKIAEAGTTIVMVTHNEEICRMADRVVRFRDGRTYEVTVNRHPVHAEELVW